MFFFFPPLLSFSFSIVCSLNENSLSMAVLLDAHLEFLPLDVLTRTRDLLRFHANAKLDAQSSPSKAPTPSSSSSSSKAEVLDPQYAKYASMTALYKLTGIGEVKSSFKRLVDMTLLDQQRGRPPNLQVPIGMYPITC